PASWISAARRGARVAGAEQRGEEHRAARGAFEGAKRGEVGGEAIEERLARERSAPGTEYAEVEARIHWRARFLGPRRMNGTRLPGTLRTVMKIGVVGGSLGGLSAALVLRRTGAEIEIFERDDDSF